LANNFTQFADCEPRNDIGAAACGYRYDYAYGAFGIVRCAFGCGLRECATGYIVCKT